VSLWVQVKADAVGAGQATIKLRTLREALSDYEVGTDELLVLLDEELRQYKAQHVDATQERYNVICDLLELCPEEEIDRCLDRSLHLIRLAEFLCYNDAIGQAECSALDCAQEAVRLLDSITVEWWLSSEKERYTDIKATANLWLFICTLEATAKKATEREERLVRVADPVLEVSVNDLDVEDKHGEDPGLHCHMLFNIASDKQACTPLDRALELWQNLLGGSTLPALNNSQQTLLNIRMMTELYRLIDKPLQALKSCLLQQQLSGWLEDWPGNIMAGCLAARLLLNLDCPQHAQVFVDEVESRMESISKPDDKLSVLEKNVKLTKSQFLYAMGQVEMGFLLLLEILEDPNIWRPSRIWYLLRSRTYTVASLYTNLPGNQLAQSERERLPQLDLRSPLVAVSVAHRLLTGLMQAILGPSFNNTQGSDKPSGTATTSIFIDQGDNVLLKWTVLTELLDVSRHLVSLQAKRGIVLEAKSFCFEALKLTTKLQLTRRCAELLIVKASLEVQRGELEESKHELKQLSFLLESSQEFGATKKAGADFKLKKLRGTAKAASKRSPVAEEEQEKESENQSFIKSVPLSLVHGREPNITGADGISSSPGLAKQKSRLPQVHKAQCACTKCRDVVLSLITAEWFLTQSRMEDALQNDTVSRRFLLAALQQAAALKQRGAAMLHEILAGRPGGWPLLLKNAAFQMTHAVEAAARLELALRGLKVGSFVGVAENVQKGLQVFQSTDLGLADAHDIKANLLIVKAIMMLLQLSLKQDCSVAELFQSSWALNTMITPCEEEPDLPSVNNTETSTSTTVASTGIMKPPPSVQKKKREFPQTPNFGFKTPARSTASRSAIKPSQGFFVLEDSNSPICPVPPCVKAQKKVKTRLRIVTFSDSDEDSELPRHQQVAASNGGSSSAKTTQSQPKKQLKSVETTAKAKGSGRMASAVQQEKPMNDAERKVLRKTKQAGRATVGRGHDAEREELRQGDTDEVWLDLDQSIEVIRALDEDSPLDKRVTRKEEQLIVFVIEFLDRDSGDYLAYKFTMISSRRNEGGKGFQSTARADGSLSLEAARDVLLAALECISHNPSGASYRVLAQLLALHAGDGLRLGDGHSEKGAGLDTAWLHNEGLSVTLRHQMIANVTRKIRKGEGEAVQCAPGSRDGHLQQILPLFNFQPQFAAGMRQRAQEFAEAVDLIPDGVAVCTLSIVNLFPWDLRKIRDVGELVLLTRLERGARPITVRLHPGKDQVGLDWVLAEFDSILKQQAVVSNMTEKKLWWQHRNELDERMQRLLTALEEQVLGCWKGLLLPPVMRSSQLAEVLHEEAEALLKQLLSDKCPHISYELLQVVLSAADSLSKKKLRSLADALCPHEDFLPRLQEAVARIRSTRIAAAAAATASTTQHPGSTVLILDKNLQKLPWENIPLLRASSVTRMPSLAFLLASALSTKYVKSNVFNSKVDVRNTFYLLNPQANLSSTESTFRDWFESEKDWEGVTGKVPTAEKIQEVLTKKDLYIYAGHGAGAQIFKPHAIPRLDCRAVSLLFGCSSGALAMRGTLEASGIALNYIMAGCPCILGNLWDVTDRDIDRYMEALLRTWLSAPPGASISEHMVHARQAPRLKFLIGAAPILYGLPV
uniref:separase n=1 Tax=Petromyzon marinus TaxID=7757 RepID=S4RE67_PETMA